MLKNLQFSVGFFYKRTYIHTCIEGGVTLSTGGGGEKIIESVDSWRISYLCLAYVGHILINICFKLTVILIYFM